MMLFLAAALAAAAPQTCSHEHPTDVRCVRQLMQQTPLPMKPMRFGDRIEMRPVTDALPTERSR